MITPEMLEPLEAPADPNPERGLPKDVLLFYNQTSLVEALAVPAGFTP